MTVTRKQRLVIVIGASVVALWLSVVVLRVVCSGIDYGRVDRGSYPAFCLARRYVHDGGTVHYQGLGYRIIRRCRLHPGNGGYIGYDYGPILRYQLNWLFLPLSDRKHVRYVQDPSNPLTGAAAPTPSAGEARPGSEED